MHSTNTGILYIKPIKNKTITLAVNNIIASAKYTIANTFAVMSLSRPLDTE